MLDVNWSPSPKQLRQFAGALAVFLGLLAAWLWHKTYGAPLVGALAGAGVLAGIVGLVRPTWMRWVYVSWMALAFPIGWLMSHLLLATVFYLVVTPIGAIMRLCGYDPLRRKLDRQASTYWLKRQPPDDAQRYFKQF